MGFQARSPYCIFLGCINPWYIGQKFIYGSLDQMVTSNSHQKKSYGHLKVKKKGFQAHSPYCIFLGCKNPWYIGLKFIYQGVSSHGKPGKVMEIIRQSLAKLRGLVPLLNLAFQHRDIDMSDMKIKIDLVFFITFCLK